MRYFVDEAPKEKVPLSTEIQFLENYIELEQIRMLYPVKLEFRKNVDPSILLPPMLLIPLVENIFKHGVDKTKEHNEAWIELEQEPGAIRFITINDINPASGKESSGVGLSNLRKRLNILYGKDHLLETCSKGNKFTVTMRIPV